MSHLGVCGGRAAGKRGGAENTVQVRWNFFEIQIIVLMTVRAAGFVQMLPFYLLRRERLGAATGCEGESYGGGEQRNWKRTLKNHPFPF